MENINLTLIQQEPALPSNNEHLIQMLGLDGSFDSNAGKLVDDIVRKLDIDSFILTPSGVPAAAIGFEGLQEPQQIVGTPYQPAEVVSYVDLTPVITPYGYENSPSSYSEDTSFSFNEDSSPPPSPQEVKPFVPSTLAENQEQDTRPSAGGKVSRRRRELKVKLYERDEPLTDPEEEKKRQNAINAKKNRDKQKNKLQELDSQVNSLTIERDSLQATNTKLKNKCESFEKQLKAICQQFNVPVIILPQD